MQAAALSSSVLRIPSFPSGSCGALDGAQSVRCSWRRRQRRASREENTRGHTRGNPVFTISEVKVHPHVLGCWVLREPRLILSRSAPRVSGQSGMQEQIKRVRYGYTALSILPTCVYLRLRRQMIDKEYFLMKMFWFFFSSKQSQMWCVQREAEVNVSHFSSQTSFECMHREISKKTLI